MTEHRVDYMPLDELLTRHAPRNPKGHNLESLKASVRRFGFASPGLLDERTGRLVVGHGRSQAIADIRAAGEEPPTGITVDADDSWLVPIVRGWESRSDVEAEAYLLADNRHTELGGWDEPALAEMLRDLGAHDPDLPALVGWSGDDLDALLAQLTDADGNENPFDFQQPPVRDGVLAEEFGVPPFTVLDTRAGYWQTRRDRWEAAGVVDGIGRGEALTFDSPHVQDPQFYDKKRAAERAVGRELTSAEFVADHYTPPEDGRVAKTGTSQFDPVLAELAVAWYSRPGARVLDPFSGGPIRGLISAFLGRQYDGVDIRREQVEANRAQAATVTTAGHLATQAAWHVGDARDIAAIFKGREPYDLLLTCPPYYDLEVYSDDPDDLSRAGSYADFLDGYAKILTDAASLLADDAWAVIVTGPVRDKAGYLCDLAADTARIMADSGMQLLNDHILLTPVSGAAVRAGRAFRATRKAARVHQYVQVFHRGLPLGDAADVLGPVVIADAEDDALGASAP